MISKAAIIQSSGYEWKFENQEQAVEKDVEHIEEVQENFFEKYIQEGGLDTAETITQVYPSEMNQIPI